MSVFSKIKETYAGAPGWAKGVVIVLGSLVTLYVGREIYKKIFPSDAEKRAKQQAKNLDGDIDALRKLYQQTYPQSQYDQMADTIYQNAKHCIGLESSPIVDVLKQMQNDLDVALLAKSYGNRQTYCLGVPSDTYTLFTAARYAIENDMYGIFSYRVDQVNSDWASKKINYVI